MKNLILACLLVLSQNVFAGSADQSLCQQHNYDVYHIAKAVSNNRPKEEFTMKVDQFERWMTPERVRAVRAMIEDAYASPDVIEWKRVNTLDCGGV